MFDYVRKWDARTNERYAGSSTAFCSVLCRLAEPDPRVHLCPFLAFLAAGQVTAYLLNH